MSQLGRNMYDKLVSERIAELEQRLKRWESIDLPCMYEPPCSSCADCICNNCRLRQAEQQLAAALEEIAMLTDKVEVLLTGGVVEL